MSKFNFDNKLIWISGASSGIGEALAYSLANKGARLILSARRKERLKQVKSNCRNAREVIVLPMDITVAESIVHAVETVKKLGTLDLIIHDVGIAQKGMVEENSMEVERRVMETNYFGTVALTKAVLPIFLKQKSGWFAVITSIAGVIGIPGRSTYSASKHALHGFFDSLRMEYIDKGIHVTVIMPGFVNTHITVKELKGDGKPFGKLEKSHELGISPEECAIRILKGLQKTKRDIIIGGFEIFSVYVNRFSPTFHDFIIRNHPMKKWRRFISKISFQHKLQ